VLNARGIEAERAFAATGEKKPFYVRLVVDTQHVHRARPTRSSQTRVGSLSTGALPARRALLTPPRAGSFPAT